MKIIFLTIIFIFSNTYLTNAISIQQAEEYWYEGEQLIREGKYDDAINLLEISARNGIAPAAFRLGNLYDKYDRNYGNIKKNKDKACYWYRYGAESGIIGNNICARAYKNLCGD